MLLGFLLQLNDFDNRLDAIEAVKKIDYKMGTTYTADALTLARTIMFTPQTGDRPNAQNLAIIITGNFYLNLQV